MATWSLDVYALNGAVTATGLPWQSWTFNYVLNSPGALEADLPLRHSAVTQAVLAPGQKELRVYRDSVLVWAGYLWGVAVQPRDSVRIRAEGYLSRFRRRFVMTDLVYSDVNQQQLAWNLISHTQGLSGGNLGITQSTHTGGNVTRDAEWCMLDHPNIGEEIEGFAEYDDGIDFEITPTPDDADDKQFKTYQPRKGSDLSGSVVFTEQNLMGYEYELSADGAVSRLVTTGNGDCNPPEDDRTDATALSLFGLLQEFETVDKGSFRAVRAYGAEMLRNRKQAQRLSTLTYAEGTGARAWAAFVVGDVIRVNAAWGPTGGFGRVDENGRVLSVEVFGQQPDNVFYRVVLDSVTT